MMNKILKSFLLLGLIGLVGFGVTQAFFSDNETSSGNTFVAGKVDLKIDHTRQTYNDFDCNTCSVVLISDTDNMVVDRDGVAYPTPSPAVLVGSNSGFIHPAWTAEEEPGLAAAGAEWIWATDPTTVEDVVSGVTYTFRKTFSWFGPIIGSDLLFGVGSDNSVEVYLNGILVGSNASEFGYKMESMLTIPGNVLTAQIVEGENTLEFKVHNLPRPNDTPTTNPGGLVYKFEIDGNCTDNFFKTNCRLWEEKDLEGGDIFWNFDDVKPGDRGINVISYHVYDNDAYMCTFLESDDLENVMIEPESPPDSLLPDVGELSQYLEFFVWDDTNGDGNYDTGETMLVNNTLNNINSIPVAEPTPGPAVPANTTNYLGVAWCFGELTATADQPFTCNGTGDHNDAQTDIVNAVVKFYVEQARNNEDFSCSPVEE